MLFSLPEVEGEQLGLLSATINEDPLGKIFFGCQRQRGGTSDNRSIAEF